jgi:hypothetical protein
MVNRPQKQGTSMNLSLTKNDSADIGFALTALLCGAIQFREFKEWLYFVIEHVEEPPTYVYDMLDVELRVDFKPQKIMGWTTSGSLSDDEHDALEGIGFLRGISDFEDRVSRVKAIEKLRSNDLFHDRVRNFFPFIDLDNSVGPDPDKGW